MDQNKMEEAHSPSKDKPRISRTKLGLTATALVSGFLIILLGIAEWYVRHRETTRHTVPGAMPHLFYQHARLKHAMVRDYDYYGWVRVNRLGLRGKDATAEKQPGVFRILAVGGSTTFDREVSRDDQAWPAQLEPMLNELGHGRSYEVLNAGVPGYRVFDNLIRLQGELLELDPDLVILYHAHNDLFGAMHPRPREWTPRPDEVRPSTVVGRWLYENTLLYGKTLERIRVLGFRRGAPAILTLPFDERLASGVDDFRSSLRSFLAVARAQDLNLIVPTVTYGWQEDHPENVAAWTRALPGIEPAQVPVVYDAFNQVIRESAQEFGYPVIETADFDIYDLDHYAELDPIHFVHSGAELMARNMADVLGKKLSRPGGPESDASTN